MKELTGTLVIGGNETTSGTFIRKEEVEAEIDEFVYLLEKAAEGVLYGSDYARADELIEKTGINKMRYTLRRHSLDNEIIEATTTSLAASRPSTWMAFIIHVDMLDPDIIAEIDESGSVEIEMEMIL